MIRITERFDYYRTNFFERFPKKIKKVKWILTQKFAFNFRQAYEISARPFLLGFFAL